MTASTVQPQAISHCVDPQKSYCKTRLFCNDSNVEINLPALPCCLSCLVRRCDRPAELCVSAPTIDRAECFDFWLLAGGFADMTKTENGLVETKRCL